MATSRRRLAASAIVALSVSVATVAASGAAYAAPAASSASSAAAAAVAPAALQFSLPASTGPYAAGEEVLHLTDTSRLDPWVPASGYRQLTVSMFYPARQGTGQPAPYMSLGEAQGFVQDRVPPGFGVTAEEVASVQTGAFTGAKAAPGKFPLVVLSPGLENPRATLTALATDLASRGFVVALVGHPGEDSGEQLADGSISPCVTCGGGPGKPTPEQITANRGVDVKFLIDQLLGGRVWKLSHLIDRHAIGMAGHSIGGAAAPAAMEDDPRISAGVNMDGTFYPVVPSGALGGRAFMMLGRDEDHTAGGSDSSWSDTWADLDGYKRWFAVAGASHAAFTDVPLLAQQAGIPLPGYPLDALRGVQITRAYVAAFFEKTLKGCPEPLLDGNSAAYPEVAIQH
ncbi:alpha/beta hydrolase [Catenulispora subtropica]|uniref:Lipase n=1 Tax=Catenulispora subtropica TaxID=450798 RepID=A0ABN2RNZ4_9ACTN